MAAFFRTWYCVAFKSVFTKEWILASVIGYSLNLQMHMLSKQPSEVQYNVLMEYGCGNKA